jgi:hypothetical protein
MKNILLLAALVLISGAAWGQAKGAKVAPNPSNLTQFGFTPAEAQAAQADFQAFEQGNRDADAHGQVIQAQRNQALVAATPDRAAFEKLTRDLAEISVKRDLARFDLTVKWRATYGVEKARTLEGILRGAAGPGGPGGPGAPKRP